MKGLILLVIIFVFSILIEAQQILTLTQTEYRKDIYKDGSQAVQSQYNLITGGTTTRYYIGKNSTVRKRAVYQWNLNEIPDGSTINSVRINFLYTAPGGGVVFSRLSRTNS